MSEVIAILAKAPELGRVKTRLASRIGGASALQVYQRLLGNLELQLREVPFEIHVHLDCLDPNSWSHFPTAITRPQVEGDVGNRMSAAIEISSSQNKNSVVLVGTDIPDLSSAIIQEAFQVLKEKDVVLGPSEDGGYYLIGMNTHHPELFQLQEWSTSEVLNRTTDICESHGLSYGLVETLNDIDRVEDLKLSGLFNDLNINFGLQN
jgi:uncharacterized protein